MQKQLHLLFLMFIPRYIFLYKFLNTFLRIIRMYLVELIDVNVFILDPMKSTARDISDEASEQDTIYKGDSGMFLYLNTFIWIPHWCIMKLVWNKGSHSLLLLMLFLCVFIGFSDETIVLKQIIIAAFKVYGHALDLYSTIWFIRVSKSLIHNYVISFSLQITSLCVLKEWHDVSNVKQGL